MPTSLYYIHIPHVAMSCGLRVIETLIWFENSQSYTHVRFVPFYVSHLTIRVCYLRNNFSLPVNYR